VYTATKHDGFYGGSDLDDWYKYTTHAACGNDYYKDLQIHVTTNKPQIEVEVFDGCGSWPITSSIWTQDPNGIKTYQFSGLVKDLDVAPLATHTYMIHVNYLRPPDTGGITYDLTVTETCRPIIY
jgi:hypothetical protein